MSKHKTALNDTLKQEFQKDLELFKYFLLLMNSSSPIRNVELMWVEDIDPSKTLHKERVNTEDALVQLQLGPSPLTNRSSPSTLFCDYVHGFGAHEETTCARSDVPAKQRCRATESSQVYPCHVGLTDIAVPVICDGQYLGTLFSGQVLSEPATAEGFERVRTSLTGQKHVDFVKLEAAYYEVPVVNQAQLSEMLRVLELFARYIANSWKRLQIMSEFQKIQDREMALNRKELAALLLSGEALDSKELNELSRSVGLKQLPDRVLVLQIKQSTPKHELNPPIAHQIILNRLSHVVEDLCREWENMLSIPVRPGEICLFTGQRTRNRNHERISLQEMAESILAALRSQGIAGARVGISGGYARPEALLRAYHEGSAALDSGTSPVCFFKEVATVKTGPSQHLAPVVQAIQKGEKLDVAVHHFLAQAMPEAGYGPQFHQSRAILTWASEHLALEMISVGADARGVNDRKELVVSEMLNALSPFSLCECFRRFSDFLAQQVALTFSQRENKIVFTVSRLVEERGVAHVTIQDLANELNLSSGHLSRVYSRTTGMTLEEFLVRQRVELSKRLLLDPRLNVAEVADRCGFCNPAYFASVFKKYVHCTPREFATQPSMWKPLVSPNAELEAARLPVNLRPRRLQVGATEAQKIMIPMIPA
jgi:AraC-like DNA-binding protein/ligand-binding sensor protein